MRLSMANYRPYCGIDKFEPHTPQRYFSVESIQKRPRTPAQNLVLNEAWVLTNRPNRMHGTYAYYYASYLILSPKAQASQGT